MYVLETAHLSKTQEAKLNLAEIKMLRFSFKPAGAGFEMIRSEGQLRLNSLEVC